MITLDEMKQYLRIDFDDDDALIQDLISGAEKECMDVARVGTKEELYNLENGKISVYYCVGYLYEHRESADHRQMLLTLRALLFLHTKEASDEDRKNEKPDHDTKAPDDH